MYFRSCLSLTSPFITFKTSFQIDTQIILIVGNQWYRISELSNKKSSSAQNFRILDMNSGSCCRNIFLE